MPFLALIIPWAKTAAEFFFRFIESRIGQIILAFVVGWIWSGWKTDEEWQSKIAAEKLEIERLYKAELKRQADAAHDIAVAATARAEEDAELVRNMQSIINSYSSKGAPNVVFKNGPAGSCVIDDDFIGIVQQLNNTSRKTKSSRSSSNIRKAR
jgi:hypothetical protein